MPDNTDDLDIVEVDLEMEDMSQEALEVKEYERQKAEAKMSKVW